VLDVVEIFLADFLALGSVQIELIEAFVQQLVRADHGLFEVGEFLGEFELLKLGEGSGGGGGGADVGGGFEELKFCQV
jgi:hypothetical protein